MQELKDSLIRQTEQAIDVLRKDKQRLENELALIEPQLEEARAMLQLIKTGVAPSANGKVRRAQTSRGDVEAMLEEMPNRFTTHDFAEAMEISRGAAANWLARYEKSGALTRIMMGRGSQPSVWEKNAGN